MEEANNQEKKGKKSVSMMIKNWFSMLAGKGSIKDNDQSAVDGAQNSQVKEPPKEDSVKEDIKKAKKLIGEGLQALSIKSQPVVEAGKKSSAQLTEKTKRVVDVKFTRMVVRIIILGLSALFILFALTRIRSIQKQTTPPDDQQVSQVDVSPTLPPYLPSEPSIYVDDETIKAIEEDARVLINEINGKKIKDDSLNFPDLDFDIKL